jgi:hypothetical protein
MKLWKAENGYDAADVDPITIPFNTRRELLNKHPIVAARHFSMRLTKFLAFLGRNSPSIFQKNLQEVVLMLIALYGSKMFQIGDRMLESSS